MQWFEKYFKATFVIKVNEESVLWTKLHYYCLKSNTGVTKWMYENGHGFLGTPKGLCWITSWENFPCCSPSHAENGGNYVKNYPFGISVSNGGSRTHDITKPKQLHKNGSQLRESGKFCTAGSSRYLGKKWRLTKCKDFPNTSSIL